jgi:hypothetical protein
MLYLKEQFLACTCHAGLVFPWFAFGSAIGHNLTVFGSIYHFHQENLNFLDLALNALTQNQGGQDKSRKQLALKRAYHSLRVSLTTGVGYFKHNLRTI